MNDASILSLNECKKLVELIFARYEEKSITEDILKFSLYSTLEKINRNSNITQGDYNKIIDLILKNKFVNENYVDSVIEEFLLENFTQNFTHKNFSKWNDYKRMKTIDNIINS